MPGMQQINPASLIAQVTRYLDKHEPTPELNCLRLVVLSGVRVDLVVSLHTTQVDLDNPVHSEPVRKFLRSMAPKGAGYYFPQGSSHISIGGV